MYSKHSLLIYITIKHTSLFYFFNNIFILIIYLNKKMVILIIKRLTTDFCHNMSVPVYKKYRNIFLSRFYKSAWKVKKFVEFYLVFRFPNTFTILQFVEHLILRTDSQANVFEIEFWTELIKLFE